MPRPDNWSLENEGYNRVVKTDYFGQPYEAWEKPKKDLGKAFASFREQFRSMPTKDITGRSGSYNPPMEQIDFRNIDNPNNI